LDDGGLTDEFGIAEGFGFGAIGADGAEVEGAIAPAAKVFDGGHFRTAELAVSAAPFDDLAFGAFGDAAFADGESAAEEPPEALAKDGLFVDGEDGFGGDGGPELTDKGGPIAAGFGAVGGDGIRGGPIAVRAEVDVGKGKGCGTCVGVQQKVQDSTTVVFHAKTGFYVCGKRCSELINGDRDDTALSPSEHFWNFFFSVTKMVSNTSKWLSP
jgi:hypothetical protein